MSETEQNTLPTPDDLLDAIKSALEARDLYREVEILHGKFRLENLDTKSFATPAAFISISSGEPQKSHAGEIKLMCEIAIMLVTKTTEKKTTAWSLSTDCLKLIHNNMWGLKHINQPSGERVIPVISAAETRKKQALTAITWLQRIKIAEGVGRTEFVAPEEAAPNV